MSVHNTRFGTSVASAKIESRTEKYGIPVQVSITICRLIHRDGDQTDDVIYRTTA